MPSWDEDTESIGSGFEENKSFESKENVIEEENLFDDDFLEESDEKKGERWLCQTRI